jgi:hypothetical protein
VTRPEGSAPGRGCLRRGFRRGGRGGGGGPRQAAVPWGQEGPRAGTPQPRGADCGDPLGPPLRQNAPEALVGGPRHGVPPRGLGVLGATAHRARIAGAEPGVGQRDPGELAAQVVPDWRRALPRRVAVDHPPRGPDPLGTEQGRAFLAHQRATPATNQLCEGRAGDAGGRARGPPCGAVGGDPARRHPAVDRRLGGQGAGPGGEETPDAQQAAHIRRVQGACAERLGGGAPPPSVPGLWVAAAEVVERLGQGQDPRTGGPWPPCLPPRCPPDLGVLRMALGTTPVAAGVVGRVRLPAVIPRPQLAPPGRGPAVANLSQRPAMPGQERGAQARLRGGTIVPEAVCPLGQARAPTR